MSEKSCPKQIEELNHPTMVKKIQFCAHTSAARGRVIWKPMSITADFVWTRECTFHSAKIFTLEPDSKS